MATATAERSSALVWHVRGSWSAREDRVASAVWLGILWLGIIAGFGVDFRRYLQENPAAPWIVHVHAVVFSVWMLVLTAQVLLVLDNRVKWHRTLGWCAAGWACLMAVMGPLAAAASQAINLHNPQMSDPPFLSVNFVDIGAFFVLLAWGITLRKNPAAHRRVMILSSVALADPGFSRFSGYFLPEPKSVIPWFIYTFYGNALIILAMGVWDWWRGRLMRQFAIGAAALLAAFSIATLLYFWTPWKTITIGWVTEWAKRFA